MYPILFTFSGFSLYSFSVFLILAWLVFSFLFWKLLRNQAVEEDHIFDLTFYSTINAFLFARVGFILTHQELFRETPIKMVAMWIQPGLSLYAGILGGMLTLLYLARRYKVRVGNVLDSLAFAIPSAFILGTVGALLDGTTVGKLTNGPWGVHYVGHVGLRHPVQVYELVVLVLLLVLLVVVHKKAQKHSWPYGIVGLWFFLLYSTTMFSIEFFKDSSVYWLNLSANQWVLIGLFGETLGAFYVRGGAREAIRPLARKVVRSISGGIGGIYAKFSKRRS